MIPRELFRDTAIRLHPRAGHELRTADVHTAFDPPFKGMVAGTYSKVKVARAVVDRLSLGDLDDHLREVVEDLAARIRTANGLPSAEGGG